MQDPPSAEGAVRQLLRLVLSIDAFGSHLRLHGIALSRTEMLVTIRVYVDGPISNNELARRMGMGNSSMNAIVTRLLDDGTIESRPDPEDRRRRLLVVSNLTRDRVREHFAEVGVANPALFDPRTGQLESTVSHVVDGLRMLLERVCGTTASSRVRHQDAPAGGAHARGLGHASGFDAT